MFRGVVIKTRAPSDLHLCLVEKIGWRRCFSAASLDPSSSSKQANASRDTRLAGRRRFYKYVDAVQVGAPWESNQAIPSMTMMEKSPISAGVDGTQSASGVTNVLLSNDETSSLELLQQRLTPRKPGMTTIQTEVTSWFGVALDGRVMKTPLGQTLAVPSEMLAWAIAAEWDGQDKYLQPAQMPLMTLACTALDQTASNMDTTQALRYLPTDTVCYWADPFEDRVLHRRQQRAWDRIHEHCEGLLGDLPAAAMGTSEGLLMSRTRSAKTHSGLPHPACVTDNAETFCATLDAWHLTALNSVTAEAKSFLVGFALLTGGADPKAAAEASRVEEEFQIENWGLVEGGHDYDRLNCSIQMSSSYFLMQSISLDNGL